MICLGQACGGQFSQIFCSLDTVYMYPLLTNQGSKIPICMSDSLVQLQIRSANGKVFVF